MGTLNISWLWLILKQLQTYCYILQLCLNDKFLVSSNSVISSNFFKTLDSRWGTRPPYRARSWSTSTRSASSASASAAAAPDFRIRRSRSSDPASEGSGRSSGSARAASSRISDRSRIWWLCVSVIRWRFSVSGSETPILQLVGQF